METKTGHTPVQWVAMGKAVHIRLSNGIGPKVVDCQDHEQAHLISAAPDMLEALEIVKGAYASHQAYDKNPMPFVERAIAKAKGKS